jgi:hypothetical protein
MIAREEHRYIASGDRVPGFVSERAQATVGGQQSPDPPVCPPDRLR